MTHERYALDSIEGMTRELAACLTPHTLTAVVVDIATSHNRSIGADVKTFANRLADQCKALTGEVPA